MFDFNDLDLEESEEDPSESTPQMPIIMPADDSESEDFDELIAELPDRLPILPLANNLLFPYITAPVSVVLDSSKRLIDSLARQEDKHVIVIAQRDPLLEEPKKKSDLFTHGVVAEVMHVAEMEDGNLTVVLRGKVRVKPKALTTAPAGFLTAAYTVVNETEPLGSDMEYVAMSEVIREVMAQMLMLLGDAPKPFIDAIKRLTDPRVIINFACNNFADDLEQKMQLLLISDLKHRGFTILPVINKQYERIHLRAEIRYKTRTEMDKQQKDYFLQQQMQQIRKELAEDDEDLMTQMLARGEKKEWPKEVGETFRKEVAKLRHMSTQSPDYSVQLQYCQTLLDLPWDSVTRDNIDIRTAQKILDRDHFGLEKVKERILEHLSVLKLKGDDLHAPILCLYGPPGVGKTSLGKSIAAALGRNYVRISLGGMHDEAEIRGHRRTYVGAMPGRIIKGFLRAGSANPVFVLDEVDKLANDYKGDPSSALLEVLDPEQNSTFHDNYLDLDYDLSRALFIATANNLSEIPTPLLDRMELIEVSGYIPEEKIHIAKDHLLPDSLEQMGLKQGDVRMSTKTLDRLITDYTQESGVRELDKRIRQLLRKEAMAAMDRSASLARSLKPKGSPKAVESQLHEYAIHYFPHTIRESDLPKLLGPAKYKQEKYDGNTYAGVVTGLAWTSVGGVILMVESAPIPSRQGKLSMTGNLGEVMKESATLALEYVKSHADMYDIDPDIFDYWDVHIHVPEGAIPKDGPSAGITLVTSLVSTFTQRQVKPQIAMTGEITLRGKVLPVGGIKEKILAAKRAGITTLILSEENRKDIEEIKADYIEGLTFVYVRDISEVIAAALSDSLVDHPVDLMKRVCEGREREQRLTERYTDVVRSGSVTAQG